MKSARSIARQALEDAHICRVADDDITPQNREKEYITVTVVSGVYTAYACNRPIQRRDNVDVDWRGVDQSIADQRMQEIEKVLTDAGFIPVSLPMDLGYDPDNQFFGMTQEFSLYRVVPHGD